ncbi:FAD-dependent oxidoreductase [Desulfotalea psychrophila]|uniref:Related to opine oxidase, subunit A n=1 Tax=Desulfotalea psychrophila (strain LSv54 / DSM 12343) TaxID=177439 RepID=Q6AR05_DESPS|nr:FAD-dependent oxidoreductase [Desulfotalea psychrophila]CAG35219.1 related to opine oxidase, subunit A [Desulfotalea psychrophila LSv54]
MSRHYDTIVIGAGAAGLTASSTLAEMGLKVLTLDEQNHIGGQIYRNIEHASDSNLKKMGPEYRRGLDLAQRFRKSGAEYEGSSLVWNVESEGRVCYSRAGVSERITANYVIIATGAMERPVPFPGWTLPGVMGAGAVNGLAKDADLTPSGSVVLAGSGPLLLLEAALLTQKKVKVAAILETTAAIPSPSILQHLPKAMGGIPFLLKGVKMLWDIKKSGVPHYKNITNLKAIGDDAVTTVTADHGRKKLKFDAEMLLVHFGVVPDTHIHRLTGCHMEWQKEQRYWYPATDSWGRTNFERIFATGDGTGVSGALAAEFKGELSALEVARCLGIIPPYERDNLAAQPLENIKKDAYPRPLIDAFFAPNPNKISFEDETVLCRCENITVGKVRKLVSEGVTDLNEVKAITRCGMGPCQGRMCGQALGEIVAAELDGSVPNAGLLKIRPPLKPLPLQEVAAMDIVVEGVDPSALFKNQSKK